MKRKKDRTESTVWDKNIMIWDYFLISFCVRTELFPITLT